jgi:hypothetical protein
VFRLVQQGLLLLCRRRNGVAMRGREWTEHEIEYLKSNYGPHSAEEIATDLGRTKGSVHTMRKRLGLNMTREQVCRVLSVTHADQSGENNPSWRGGISSESYRYTKQFRSKHPERHTAHCQVRKAIRSGRLTRQPCEVCGCEKVEAHHEDYGQPLNVIWLCRTHHIAADRARREREQSTTPSN